MHGVKDHHTNTEEARVVGLPVKFFYQDEITVVNGVMERLNAVHRVLAYHLVDQFALAGRHVQGNQ